MKATSYLSTYTLLGVLLHECYYLAAAAALFFSRGWDDIWITSSHRASKSFAFAFSTMQLNSLAVVSAHQRAAGLTASHDPSTIRT